MKYDGGKTHYWLLKVIDHQVQAAAVSGCGPGWTLDMSGKKRHGGQWTLGPGVKYRHLLNHNLFNVQFI